VKTIRWLTVWAALAVGVPFAQAQSNLTYTGEVLLDPPKEAWSYPSKASPVGDRVRVAFYNIENFTDGEGDGPDRTEERIQAQARGAAELIDEMDADVLILSEVENVAAIKILNRALAKPYPFGWISAYGAEDWKNQKMNEAVLSRFPATELMELDFGHLAGSGRPTRGILRAGFDLGDGHELVVYGAHLKSNYGYRPRNISQRNNAMQIMAKDARALQKKSAGKVELLLLGDTNVDPEVPEFAGDWSMDPIRSWADLWLGKPLHERTTIPTRYGDPAKEFPPASFDRIYAGGDATVTPWVVGAPGVLQRGVNTKNVNALPGEDGHISDHFPVWVDLHRESP